MSNCESVSAVPALIGGLLCDELLSAANARRLGGPPLAVALEELPAASRVVRELRRLFAAPVVVDILERSLEEARKRHEERDREAQLAVELEAAHTEQQAAEVLAKYRPALEQSLERWEPEPEEERWCFWHDSKGELHFAVRPDFSDFLEPGGTALAVMAEELRHAISLESGVMYAQKAIRAGLRRLQEERLASARGVPIGHLQAEKAAAWSRWRELQQRSASY